MAVFYFFDYFVLGVNILSVCAGITSYVVGEHHLRVQKNVKCTYATHATMICQEIPDSVPDFIDNVIVKSHSGELSRPFTGAGWDHVQSLDIYGHSVQRVEDDDFKGLNNTKLLNLRFPSLVQFYPKSFLRTPKVQRFSVIGSQIVHTNELMDAITHSGALPNLKEFVFNPGKQNTKPQFILNGTIVNQIVERPLKLMNISDSMLSISPYSVVRLLLKLEILNVSRSQLHFLKYYDFSESSEFQKGPFLQILDISGLQTEYSTQQYLSLVTSNYFAYLCINVEHLYANEVYTVESNFTQSYNFTNQSIFLKTVHFAGNSLTRINSTLTFNLNNSIEVVDLSHNKLEYISAGAVSCLAHLKELYLSKNKLYMMGDFRSLLLPLASLSIIDISNNGFTNMTWDMFNETENLRKIYLADNKLTTLSFDIKKLKMLKLLDLQRNAIHFIEGYPLLALQAFVIEQKTGGIDFSILLQGNPLQCKCASLDFIKWLTEYIKRKQTTEMTTYTCNYGDLTINVDASAVKRCEFLCKRSLIIVLSSVGSTFMVSLTFSVICVLRKRIRRSRMQRMKSEYMTTFQAGLSDEMYVCFLAYASRDEDIVQQGLLTPLDSTLKLRLETNRTTVSTGYDFRPGFAITEEIHRLIKQSSVFIAVVSDAFCNSEYCKGEINEACAQQKPIVVVVLDRVKEETLTAYLREVLRRKVRASLLQKKCGTRELVPDKETLCDSILALAFNAQRI